MADRVKLPDGTPVSEKWAGWYEGLTDLVEGQTLSRREKALVNCIADLSRAEARIEQMRQALKGARTNIAYAHQPENCGDHCRNSCRDCVLRYTLEDIDAALAAGEGKENGK